MSLRIKPRHFSTSGDEIMSFSLCEISPFRPSDDVELPIFLVLMWDYVGFDVYTCMIV